jgi:tetratricopeptide (TPR) repeat protein
LNNALEIFKEAIKLNPNSPLYHCNLGKVYHALSEKDSAILSFQKAHELIENNKFGEELNSENKAYIEKVLNEFVSQVKDLNKISLEKKDDVIAKRELKFIDTKLESLTKDIDNEEQNQEHKKILDTKEKLKIVQGIQPIYEYYDGFIFNINKSYSTALVVNSDTFNISTSNLAVDTASKLISLIPLVGETASQVVDTVKDFVIEAQTKRAANNVCKFASGVTEFESLAQDAVLGSIFSKKDALSTVDPEKYILRTWADKFKNIVEKTQDKIETKLYGTRYETPMQKLGYKDSCELVEKIASGEIYKGEIAIRISPAEKVSRLNNEASSIIDKELENWSKQYTEQPQTVKNVQAANNASCCLIFAQNGITYDNELLNHPNILKSLLNNYGLSQILDLSSQLDKDLILEASITNDPEIVLAGLMSIESSY